MERKVLGAIGTPRCGAGCGKMPFKLVLQFEIACALLHPALPC